MGLQNLHNVYGLPTQRCAKSWFLGHVNTASWLPLAVGHEFSQPRSHILEHLYRLPKIQLCGCGKCESSLWIALPRGNEASLIGPGGQTHSSPLLRSSHRLINFTSHGRGSGTTPTKLGKLASRFGNIFLANCATSPQKKMTKWSNTHKQLTTPNNETPILNKETFNETRQSSYRVHLPCNSNMMQC